MINHITLGSDNREAVDAFYQAALAVGGFDNGKPGVRPHYSPNYHPNYHPHYHPNYYSAFILDSDGRNIEAVCHGVPA